MKKMLLFTISFFICNLDANIITTKQMATVLAHALQKHAPSTLIVFDFDNTIARLDFNQQHYGGHEWFVNLFAQKIKDGHAPEQVKNWLLPIYHILQETVPMKLVEEETATIINTLQQSGYTIIVLTMRSQPIVDATLNHFANLGLDFSNHGLFSENFDLTIPGSSKPALCRNNVIFCNENSKSSVLLKLLEYAHDTELVIFTDDDAKYITNVHDGLEKAGKQTDCFHYTNVDMNEFNAEQAQQELETFFNELEKNNPELHGQLHTIY